MAKNKDKYRSKHGSYQDAHSSDDSWAGTWPTVSFGIGAGLGGMYGKWMGKGNIHTHNVPISVPKELDELDLDRTIGVNAPLHAKGLLKESHRGDRNQGYASHIDDYEKLFNNLPYNMVPSGTNDPNNVNGYSLTQHVFDPDRGEFVDRSRAQKLALGNIPHSIKKAAKFLFKEKGIQRAFPFYNYDQSFEANRGSGVAPNTDPFRTMTMGEEDRRLPGNFKLKPHPQLDNDIDPLEHRLNTMHNLHSQFGFSPTLLMDIANNKRSSILDMGDGKGGVSLPNFLHRVIFNTDYDSLGLNLPPDEREQLKNWAIDSGIFDEQGKLWGNHELNLNSNIFGDREIYNHPTLKGVSGRPLQISNFTKGGFWKKLNQAQKENLMKFFGKGGHFSPRYGPDGQVIGDSPFTEHVKAQIGQSLKTINSNNAHKFMKNVDQATDMSQFQHHMPQPTSPPVPNGQSPLVPPGVNVQPIVSTPPPPQMNIGGDLAPSGVV